MRLRDTYDVPEGIVNGVHSHAFDEFLWNWFGDTGALTHGELDLSFLRELSPEELATARDLIRRNLKTGQTHIIEGASALGDVEAAPVLRMMLDAQADHSRRLTIAGALWKLVRDPVFITCLEEARREGGGLVLGAHMLQVLWLDDERAVDFLISLLDQQDWFVRAEALRLLNTLETGAQMFIPAKQMPNQPDDYRKRRLDPVFREKVTAAVHKWNREMKNGR